MPYVGLHEDTGTILPYAPATPPPVLSPRMVLAVDEDTGQSGAPKSGKAVCSYAYDPMHMLLRICSYELPRTDAAYGGPYQLWGKIRGTVGKIGSGQLCYRPTRPLRQVRY
eukprot:647797-Rhodomonas_salina.1